MDFSKEKTLRVHKFQKQEGLTVHNWRFTRWSFGVPLFCINRLFFCWPFCRGSSAWDSIGHQAYCSRFGRAQASTAKVFRLVGEIPHMLKKTAWNQWHLNKNHCRIKFCHIVFDSSKLSGHWFLVNLYWLCFIHVTGPGGFWENRILTQDLEEWRIWAFPTGWSWRYNPTVVQVGLETNFEEKLGCWEVEGKGNNKNTKGGEMFSVHALCMLYWLTIP